MMPLALIQAEFQQDFAVVHRLMTEAFASKAPLIQAVGAHLLAQPGKGLRPLLVLISAQASGYQGTQHYSLAAAIELIHTATLLHDDVVDEADKRRGQPSTNQRFGNKAAILSGDFLYAKAFQLLLAIDHPNTIEILVNATHAMAEGEALQLLGRRQLRLSTDHYMEIIAAKTASLFGACTHMAAVLAGAPAAIVEAWMRYGVHLGLCFQIMDDVLDYEAIAHATHKGHSKNPGNDLREGKMTLPLIYGLAGGTDSQIQVIQQALAQPHTCDTHLLSQVLDALETSGALAESRRCAAEQARQAQEALLTVLSPSVHRDRAIHLAASLCA